MDRKNKNKIKWQIVNTVMFFIILIMSGYYVAIVNDIDIKQLKQNAYKIEMEERKEESRNLNNQISFYKSYKVLSEKTENLKMVPVNDIAYIESSNKLAINYKE